MLTTPKPRITSMTISYTPKRAPPKVGDLRETKAHGKQVRIFLKVWQGPHKGAYISCGGRACFEWVSYQEAVQKGFGNYVPKVTAC